MSIPSRVARPTMPAVQVPDPSGSMPASPSTSRRAGRAAAVAVAAGAVLGSVVPAQAETYYTGQCSVREDINSQPFYRTFQARIVGSIENGTGKYIWNHYDYRYSIDVHLQNGASSDELVAFKSGYSDGLSTPWQSPDNHGSTGDWITEGNWKGAKSYWGYTKVNFYAAFDVPRYADPHCSAATAVV